MTGDPTTADEIELTLWNQAMAAQHPSGDWCTYDTPLNGLRAPSYHQINFQYRPGAPELNCCSVNGPRTLGMLSEWAVTRDNAGLFVNFYGPSDSKIALKDGAAVRIVQKTEYPVDGHVKLEIQPEKEFTFALRLRVPAWSKKSDILVNGQPAGVDAKAGSYATIQRAWKAGDTVELSFDMTPRCLEGQAPDRGGRGAFQVGPLLLAFDAYFNTVETPDVKPINAAELKIERVPVTTKGDAFRFAPMGLWRTQSDDGATITLCDFASAGAHGTDYAAWLPVSHLKPQPAHLKYPANDAVGSTGPVMFQWVTSGGADSTYDLVIAKDAEFKNVVATLKDVKETRTTITQGLEQDGTYYWKIEARNPYGVAGNADGPRTFRVDAKAEPFFSLRPDGLLFASGLDGSGKPSYGTCSMEEGLNAAPDRQGKADGALAFSVGSKLRYKLPFYPERDYSFTAWVCPEGLPSSGGQIVSGWCRGLDDPLRIMMNGDEVSARIEAGSGSCQSAGTKLVSGTWYHIAAVKDGKTLTLYVNGQKTQSTAAPELIRSQCVEVGVGFNPLYTGGEHFVGRIDDVALYARALSAEDVAKAAAR